MGEGQGCFGYYSSNQKLVKKMCHGAVQVHPVYIAGRANQRSNMEKYRKSELYIVEAGLEGKIKGSLQLSGWTSGINYLEV